MSVRIKVDGNTLTVNQSALQTFLRCPEQFRRSAGVGIDGLLDPADDRLETDAATCGTAFHEFVELELSEGRFRTEVSAQKQARVILENLLASYVHGNVPYMQASFGPNPEAIFGKLSKLISIWFHSEERNRWLHLVQHHPEAIRFEHEFDVPFLENLSGHYQTVRLAGTIDVVDSINNIVVDWKTSSRYKTPWEHQRWDIQSNVYTYAAATEGLILPDADGGYEFGWRVFNHKANDTEPQAFSAKRSPNNWAWLTEVVSQMVTQIESGMPRWIANDTHALCSPKWCPHWDDCKGLYIDGDKQWY